MSYDLGKVSDVDEAIDQLTTKAMSMLNAIYDAPFHRARETLNQPIWDMSPLFMMGIVSVHEATYDLTSFGVDVMFAIRERMNNS